MASTKDYRDYILDQLSILNGITYKPMMGEYLLYYNGVLFGGIYDDRFLVKKTETNSEYEMEEAIPYTGAKPMYMVDSDDQELLKDIVLDTVRGLKK
jgi:TfoX/Sxy family transcriptional regulator of competence genes